MANLAANRQWRTRSRGYERRDRFPTSALGVAPFLGALVKLDSGSLVSWTDAAGAPPMLLESKEDARWAENPGALAGVVSMGQEVIDVTIAGTPAVGVDVFCADDDIRNATTVAGTRRIGWITEVTGSGRGSIRLLEPEEA